MAAVRWSGAGLSVDACDEVHPGFRRTLADPPGRGVLLAAVPGHCSLHRRELQHDRATDGGITFQTFGVAAPGEVSAAGCGDAGGCLDLVLLVSLGVGDLALVDHVRRHGRLLPQDLEHAPAGRGWTAPAVPALAPASTSRPGRGRSPIAELQDASLSCTFPRERVARRLCRTGTETADRAMGQATGSTRVGRSAGEGVPHVRGP